MSTMTLADTIIENLRRRRGFDRAFDLDDDILEEIQQEMADAIDILLREQESAKAGVTEEMVAIAEEAFVRADCGPFGREKQLQAALKAVVPMLAKASESRRHVFYSAGEPDCPTEIKASNGEIYTLRCRNCGLDNPDEPCTGSHMQPEDSRCPPTYRRESAVKALIAMGWRWNGNAWVAPMLASARVPELENEMDEMKREELKDAIAKAIADCVGHGMREKCERHADAVMEIIDALLRERESAKAAVTDEMVNIAWGLLANHQDNISPLSTPSVRAALEAVAPMLASVRVPDAMEVDDSPFQTWNQDTYKEYGYALGWNACRATMLAATPKPEKE